MSQHRVIHDGDETEAYSRYWRKAYAYLQRPGVIKKVKRRTHRRERRDARGEIRDLAVEYELSRESEQSDR